MLLYLITYDISCDKRRRKVSDLLEGYGTRVQHSVFECVLPRKKYKELKRRLLPVVNPQYDSLRLYPLSAHTLGTIEAWGGEPLTQEPSSIIA